MKLPTVGTLGKSALCLAFTLLLSAYSTHAAGLGDNRTSEGAVQVDTRNNSRIRISDGDASQGIKWLCYYGSNRGVLDLHAYQLLVLEADALGPITNENRANRVCVAYMSMGEISQNRWFWPLVQDKPWVLGENPDWPDSHRIDPRSAEWSDMLINTIAPMLMAAGYDGFMLDNVDIGEYLENTNPEKYAGAKDAAAGISGACGARIQRR